MTSYYNVTTATEDKDGNTYFNKVGVAYPSKDDAKSVMTIKLFAIPTNGELVLFEPKSKNEND